MGNLHRTLEQDQEMGDRYRFITILLMLCNVIASVLGLLKQWAVMVLGMWFNVFKMCHGRFWLPFHSWPGTTVLALVT